MIQARGELVERCVAYSEPGPVASQTRTRWLGDLLQQIGGVGGYAVCGNHIVREWSSGRGINDGAETGEITRAHRHRGDRRRDAHALDNPLPFIIPEEKGLVLLDWSAETGSELVLPKWWLLAVKKVPSIKHVVAQELINC